MGKALHIDNVILKSRLFLGTAQYPSPDILRQCIEAAQPGLITVSLRRESAAGKGQKFWDILKSFNIPVLPNTAGCFGVKEAVTTAEMAREEPAASGHEGEQLGPGRGHAAGGRPARIRDQQDQKGKEQAGRSGGDKHPLPGLDHAQQGQADWRRRQEFE